MKHNYYLTRDGVTAIQGSYFEDFYVAHELLVDLANHGDDKVSLFTCEELAFSNTQYWACAELYSVLQTLEMIYPSDPKHVNMERAFVTLFPTFYDSLPDEVDLTIRQTDVSLTIHLLVKWIEEGNET